MGAKVRSKNPPMPPAPFQVVRTLTVDVAASAGRTVQTVTMDDAVSVSTRVPSAGWVTATTCSRTRFDVAANRQCTRVPAPTPPDWTT